jgi:PAS domain S-box-containing protein
MWPFDSSRRKERRAREMDRMRRIAESQQALLTAATSTADAAHHVTFTIKAKLEDSIRQFEATIALISDALMICDSSGTVMAVNPATTGMFGCTSEQLIHKTVLHRFSRFDGLSSIDVLWEAFEADEASKGILRGRRCSGETFDIDVSFTRLERNNGEALVLMLVRDITHSKHIARGAELREQHFRSLFDLSFDGILIVQNQRIVAANKAAGALFGRDPNMLLCMRLDALVHDDALGDVDDKPTAPVEVEASLDGRSVQLLFSNSAITWNDDAAILVTVKDISETRRLMTRLGRENGVDMICVFGPDFRVAFVNEAFANYYGVERHSMTGMDLMSVLPEGDKDALLLNLRGLTAQNPSRRMQFQGTGADGKATLQDWIDHATFDKDGKVIEYQRTGRDVSSSLCLLLDQQS